MKKIILLFVAICSGLVVNAQTSDAQEKGFFKHLDASLTAGSTGLGFDLASPMGEYVQLRAGFAFMPHINYTMGFDVQVGENAEESKSKFQRLSGILEGMTGYKVNNSVDMIGVPTYYNFNLFVDVLPFKNNKHWHFTAGFYLGNSMIGKGYNTTEDMPSLVAVGIYNTMYEKAIRKEPFVTFTYNGSPVALTDDPEYQDMLYYKFKSYGRMGVRIGDYVSDGSPYIVEPDENSMVKAEVRVNAFKPYLGFGYGGRLLKGDDRYKISFDCGAMFWGGTPSILTHDGTDLAKEVKNVRGKVGDYVDLVKGVKVFPVLNVRVTRTLF
ncbi:MAG: hypothetical protein J5658_05170 [Prevotella sp.]|nr:hypothetical protein [Prevotella sp.]